MTAALQGDDWLSKYQADRTQQQARDQYDALHHPIAQRVGQAVGTAASLLATDGLTAPAGAARIGFTASRLAGGSALRALTPWAAAGGAGAVANVAGQGFTDAMTGHLSDLPTYASDAVGGAVGGIATLARSPSAGAAASAAASGLTHSALTGTPLDFDQMSRDAVAEGAFGVLGHVSGTQWAQDLSRKQKGDLGEYLAKRTAQLYGNKVTGSHESITLSNGRKTIVDHQTTAGPIEAKFGNSAKLSTNQKFADKTLPDYNILHYLPTDIGRFTGGVLSLGSAHSSPSALQWMTQTNSGF